MKKYSLKVLSKMPLTVLLALVLLCTLWELWLAPLRGVGTTSILALKALPLVLAIPGFWRESRYTYQWMSLAVWLYFTEGVVRGWSDLGLSATLAQLEAILSVLLFVALIVKIRQLRKL